MDDTAGAPGDGADHTRADEAAQGFDTPAFDLHRDDVSVAEIAELREIRAGLIQQARVIAEAEARRVRMLARATEIAQARMARVSRRSPRGQQMELRSIAAELALAVRENDRTMLGRLGDAEQMVRLFPTTVEALAEGRVSRAHASAILEAGCPIDDDEVRAAFERVVVEYAEKSTPARTRAFARGLAERMHPRSIDERFAEASAERRVTVTELDDGMAKIEALLPATLAFGIYDRLTRGARAIHEADLADRREYAPTEGGTDDPPRFDERSRDEVRADLFADLLLTGSPAIDPTVDRSPGGIGAIRARVQITVPVTTLTGTTVGGAELNGRAPVDTETARRLAADAPGWDRVMTDPVRGTVLEVDRYEPLVAQRRFLIARDVHCRWPGCRRVAQECELDHNDEHQHGGRTRLDNLAHFCCGHHTIKTETAWTVRQKAGGSLEWTSPLGYTYRNDPPARVVFVPDPPSGPHDPPAPF